MRVLEIDQSTLLNAQQMKTMGADPFCRKQLGLTKGDLALMRKSRWRRPVSATTTIAGVPAESSFNKFAEWLGRAYTTARKRNRGRWKTVEEQTFEREIRSLAKQQLDDQTLQRLLLNSFYLFWNRNLKVARSVTKKQSA